MPAVLPIIALVLLWTIPPGAAGSAAESASAAAPITSAAAAEPCADLPAFCRWEVRRIEEACAAGLAAAASPDEAAEALRLRNAELRTVMERTYTSVLTWLLGRGDLARVLEEDQAEFNQLLHALPAGDAKELNGIADKLRDRLRVFGAITGDGFAPTGMEE